MPSFPYVVSIGEHRILYHTIAELLAMFLGFRYYLYLKSRQGDAISSQNRLIILIGAVIGALAGSRIVGGLEDMEQMKNAENTVLYFFENKSIAGGLLGGLFGVELIKLAIGEKRKSGDLFVFPLLLAMITGRTGCFSMGVHESTYGIPTKGFTGMDLGDGISRHPVMLYEIAFLALLWLILYFIKKKYALRPGLLFQYFMTGYLLFRFFMEFLKPNKIYFLHLGTIQMACLAGCLYYLIDYLKAAGNQRTTP